MIAVVTLLLAFPLGFLLRSRLAANTAYAVAYLWAFVFQTLYLLLDSLGATDDPAFVAGESPLSYGLVTAGVFAIGFAMVALGHFMRARRQTSSPSSGGPAVVG